MPFPSFDTDGNLPPGVYPVALGEALAHFGRGSVQRRIVAARLEQIHCLTASTGRLARFVVFGSFVTDKSDPRDVDIVLVMDDAFDLSSVAADVAVVFRHADADTQLGASVFWTTRSGGMGGVDAFIDHWQVRRGGGLRGIVEILPEKS